MPISEKSSQPSLVCRVELTCKQMTLLKWAVGDSARWYAEHGGDVLAERVTEYRELGAYLDKQIPEFQQDFRTENKS